MTLERCIPSGEDEFYPITVYLDLQCDAMSCRRAVTPQSQDPLYHGSIEEMLITQLANFGED